ncbi:carboxypeptidase-like regulatory domain-containing protein [Pedobacter antarcticus]|uniref:carboxypeptidase-like regulatory domain-containing protein n=1 Tax=Pedobacter antarcticus TaxID=34086 RepID=UPI001C5883CF|nr:carboxypeptidase-like regulatory domain-containing protein [Pedobacter antarcticus]
MKSTIRKFLLLILFLIIISGTNQIVNAQSLLNRTVSIRCENQSIGKVMGQIEEKAGFRFSYQSKIIPKDSLISLQVTDISIKEVLDELLKERYDYAETQNFIILRYAPKKLSLVLDKASGDRDQYNIRGYVIDENTGLKIQNASVYEKNLAQATLTDNNGYFEIGLSNIYQPIALRINKENYKELITYYLLEVNIQRTKKEVQADDYSDNPEDLLTSGLTQFLISSKQRIHALNLGSIISKAPYQVSLTPAINSHGNFSGQVVNDISLNLIGGYNAGVDGVEVGGIFNLNKMNMRGVQLAGIFNITGGKADGVQLAGIYNDVKGDRRGVQIAGIFNNVQGNSSGIQLAGIFNKVHGSSTGLQISALNQANQFSGLQIGLINVAGSSSGYSLGLLNIIGNGFQRISINTNETTDINLGFKSGNNNLYTALLTGMNRDKDHKMYHFGLGLGTVINMSRNLALSPEISSRYMYLGDWKDTNILHRLDLNFNFRIADGLRLTAGPSANIYYSNQAASINGYADMMQRKDHFNLSNSKLKGWIGWTAGFTIF